MRSRTDLGTHTMFLAEVVNVRADSRYMDPDTGRFMLEKANLLAYVHGHYYALGDMIGKFGFSVQKKKPEMSKKKKQEATKKEKK